MAGFTAATDEHLIRSQIWSTQIKEFLEDDIFATRYVDWLTDQFPDGTTLNIPSIGQAEVQDYVEDQAINYNKLDTGNFTFTINKYKSSATYISDKYKQDAFYTSQLVSRFVPSMSRALAKSMEVDMLKVGPDGQTASNTNTINGAYHRWVGSGTNEVIDVKDFAKARYALQKANVPMTNLVAIVDPSVEFQLSTLANFTNLSYNPMWEGIVSSGISTGMRFLVNVYGFDVYISQNLKVNTASETIGTATASAGVNNLFFSAASDILPFVGAVRQQPRVESERNKDYQRDEYVVTSRYDFALYRPENLCVVLTDTDQVYS